MSILIDYLLERLIFSPFIFKLCFFYRFVVERLIFYHSDG